MHSCWLAAHGGGRCSGIVGRLACVGRMFACRRQQALPWHRTAATQDRWTHDAARQSHWSCTRAWRPRAHLHRRGVDRACERAHCSWTAQHLRTAAAAPAGLALRLHSVVHWHGWWQGLRRSVVLRPTRGAPPLRLAPTLVRLSRVVAVVASGRFFPNVDRVETTFFCATVRSRIGLTTSHITKIHVTLIRPFTRFRSRRARRTRARARRPLALPAASRCRSPRCMHSADPHARHCVPASSWRTRAAPSTAPVGQNRGRV